MNDIKPNDIIRVPYEQLELLLMACYLQNGCENKSECRCRRLVIETDKPKEIYE